MLHRSFNSTFLLDQFSGLFHGAVRIIRKMNTDPNMSEQSGQIEQSGSQNQSINDDEKNETNVQKPKFIGP